MPSILITPRGLEEDKSLFEESSVEPAKSVKGSLDHKDHKTENLNTQNTQNSTKIVDLSPKRFDRNDSKASLLKERKTPQSTTAPRSPERTKALKKIRLKKAQNGDILNKEKKKGEANVEMSAYEKMKSYLEEDLRKEQ